MCCDIRMLVLRCCVLCFFLETRILRTGLIQKTAKKDAQYSLLARQAKSPPYPCSFDTLRLHRARGSNDPGTGKTFCLDGLTVSAGLRLRPTDLRDLPLAMFCISPPLGLHRWRLQPVAPPDWRWPRSTYVMRWKTVRHTGKMSPYVVQNGRGDVRFDCPCEAPC